MKQSINRAKAHKFKEYDGISNYLIVGHRLLHSGSMY